MWYQQGRSFSFVILNNGGRNFYSKSGCLGKFVVACRVQVYLLSFRRLYGHCVDILDVGYTLQTGHM